MKYVKFLSEIKEPKVRELGGKGYSLAILMNNGFNVPKGFVVVSQAFFDYLKYNGSLEKVRKLSEEINENNFQEKSKEIRNLILKGSIPKEIKEEIREGLEKLKVEYVAVRSSAVSEDSLKASFAGLHDTFLNIKTGAGIIIENVKKCWASLFNDRAVIYRIKKRIPHLEGIAVIVQEMIPAKISGIIFTTHPMNKGLLIEYAPVRGQRIVSGEIIPNSIIVDRITLRIIERKEFDNDKALVPEIIRQLALIGLKIERVFSFPQDIEWCIYQNAIWILQSRAITSVSKENIKERLILEGIGASGGVARGRVRLVLTPNTHKMKDGEILVTVMTNPLYMDAIVKAKAIITDLGGLLCHAAIVARELGIPCVTATKKATKILADGKKVIVNGTEGLVYEVYE